ncbi:vacuolar protein sorting 39 [Rhodnius prolixus]|uniref:vacuolar protein sorting 39 n=1 Tax=Rhodnius prolixus TaxID=13249 RepID=UPI003D18D969
MAFTHDAYEYTQLLKLAVQIESLAAYGDRLLVGTKQGHLMFYSVTRQDSNKGDQKPDVKLLRYNKNFSKKPIQQIAVVPDYDIIIKLSDGVICVHDLSCSNFSLIKALNKTKGASLFAIDIQRNLSMTGVTSLTVRLCVSVKRKLQLYYLKNREFFDLMPEITLSDIPRALAWSKDSICVGFKGGYTIVKLSGGEEELFPTGRQLEPLVNKIPGKEKDMFVLGKETQSVFVETNGEPVANCDIVKWTDIPVGVGYDEPYLIAALTECVEIKCWNVEGGTEITSLPLKARLVCPSRPGLVYLASNELIWALQAVPAQKQIKLLLPENRFELALRLANITDDSEEQKLKNINKIQTMYAFDLFRKKKFGKSMDEFFKLNTDPYEVIKLFPELVLEQNETPKQEMSDRDLENGYLALIKYLTEVRHKLMSDETKITYKSPDELMQIIDTTLLKCYLQTNDALVAPLLRRNYCNLEETEKTLKKHHKYRELIVLYRTKDLHDKALDLLQKQALLEDSPLRGHDPTIQYLQNLGKDYFDLILKYSVWVLEAYPDDGLKIFTEDIPEVEGLPRPKVLDFLLRTEKSNLIIPYIEHAIHVWNEKNVIFHNALIHQYRKRILALGADEKALAYKGKLLHFLETSDHYSPAAVLDSFPNDSMFEERALINGKLGLHEHALSIYLILLGDYNRALEYCDKVYKEGGPGSDKVYVEVLKLLLSPPDSIPGVSVPMHSAVDKNERPVDVETALTLLEAHPSRVHVLEALTHIPDNVPLSRLRHFLAAGLRDIVRRRRNCQLLRGLLFAQRLQVKKQKMEHESKKIVITELMVCPVCKKRFGNQSAFVRYPNGNIVHYSCQDKMN